MERQERLAYLTNRMMDLGHGKPDVGKILTEYLKAATSQDLNTVIRRFGKRLAFVKGHVK